MSTRALLRSSLIVVAAAALAPRAARAEVILQYFETSWAEIEARMPEIAAAGYDAVWLPPPTKGTEGVRDVGFAVYDRFDLGDRLQRGTTATRYGTKDELLAMTAAAKKFGVRVYFDVVMNHNGNPSTIENSGVSIDLVELDAWPSMSVFDFHVVPARDPVDGNCPGGGTGCEYCAFQPQHAPEQTSTTFGEFAVVNEQGAGVALNSGGWDLCMKPTSGETRVAAVTIAQARLDEGGDDLAGDAVLQAYEDMGYTHLVSAPRWNFAGGHKFEEQNWTLLGLFDIATEQYTDVPALDGYNATSGLPLPRFVRHPGRPELYPDGPPADEDAREYLMRWIRWLMLETGAAGFRLDAIKHVYPNFYGSDFAGDEIAFVKVIQDTYDEMHGFTDINDGDLIDDAAAFGEAFTGSCDELRPYLQAGMRALDFPLFFNVAGRAGMTSGDIGQLSARITAGCEDLGAFGGLNRTSGVGFASSHDECGSLAAADTNGASPTFSRCDGSGPPDVEYGFILTRDADAAVFFDGNNWTNESFVRSGRADALGDTYAGAAQTKTKTLVRAARRITRGTQENVWVGGNAYAYERVVAGRGPAGLVVLNDGEGGDVGFGDGASTGSFIVTRFPPGTALVDVTGTSTFGVELDVLSPADEITAGHQSAVDAAIANYQAANGTAPPLGYGLVYAGVPARQYVVLAPPPYALAAAPATDVVFTLDGVPTATLAPGVHGLLVRTRRAVAGAADAIDHIVVSLCVPDQGDASVCGAAEPMPPPVPSDDPLQLGLVAVDVDGASAPRRAVRSAPPRLLPDGTTTVERAVVYQVVVDGDVLDIRAAFGAALPPDQVGVRLDGDVEGLPGAVFTGTPERWLDGFAKLYPPGEEPSDGGFVDVDGGFVQPDAGTQTPSDAGAPVSDDAGLSPAGDEDGDGVANADDVCPAVRDADQADFDEDGVGDACDDCPLDRPGIDVGADGCIAVSAQQRDIVQRIARAIALGEPATLETDVDSDGVVDVRDLHEAIGVVHRTASGDGGVP